MSSLQQLTIKIFKMALKQAISEFWDIELYLTAAGDTGGAAVAAPIDAFKAALEVVADQEGRYAKLGAAGAPDLAGVTVLKTGATPFQIHVFTVTSTMATGVYLVIYVETVPTAEDVS